MTSFRSMTAILALSTALAAPAFAQSTTNQNTTNPATTGPAMSSPATSPTAMGTAPRGTASTGIAAGGSTYLTGDKDVRASKVIGASVYNDHDQKIGTVDELLMAPNHDVTQVVLSVGGFLGVDSKLVAVNIDRLQVRPDRIVMDGATKDGLTKMPTYKFADAS
jgi:sporulation protein YlmC with PRC-barrel domain